MNWTPMLNTVAAVGSIIGGIGAIGAWVAAAQSKRISKRSADATDTLTALELERQRVYLTPEFDLTLDTNSLSTATLVVTLKGPAGLDHLDWVTVSIRDDNPAARDAYQQPAGSRTSEEDLRAQIWGPYRFRPHTDGADSDGRSAGPAPLTRGESLLFTLEPTRPPHWSADPGDGWRRQYDGAPVRLLLLCELDGYEPWSVPAEISRAPRPYSAPSSPPPTPGGSLFPRKPGLPI